MLPSPCFAAGGLTLSPACRGFTKFSRDDFLAWKKEGRLVNDGVNARLISNHGRLHLKRPEHLFETPAMEGNRPLHTEA